ncbi:MAG: LpqN/LpqT family lipoprotein [Mycobacterium sp.]|nr:LpqN/LpqT family lipoprotein [Mycobacterium sp.]
MHRSTAAVLVTAAVTIAGCSTKTADYSTIWTSSTSSTTTTVSTSPTPIAQYLSGVGVTGQQVPLDKLTELTVTLPRPPGWTKYANPNFSPGTEAIAKNNSYPTAMVMVFKLDGNFDIPAALEHADDDAELSKNFVRLNYSNADFAGFPSSMIEGSYDHNETRLHTYNRIVFPVTPKFDRYLVQFTVTTLADQAAAAAPDVLKVIEGFTVAVK